MEGESLLLCVPVCSNHLIPLPLRVRKILEIVKKRKKTRAGAPRHLLKCCSIPSIVFRWFMSGLRI